MRDEKERKKARRCTKLTFSGLVFSTSIKVSRTIRVDLALEQQRDAVCKLFAPLCSVFVGTAPITYVQAAVLNLPNP